MVDIDIIFPIALLLASEVLTGIHILYRLSVYNYQGALFFLYFRFARCTVLSASDPVRERFFFRPHQRPSCTRRPCLVGKVRMHLLHLWLNFISTISVSVVADTVSRLWICMALVLSSDTDIAASLVEPDAMLDSRSEERCASSSTSPASSAYARSDTCTAYGSDPSLIPAFGLSYSLMILQRPTINATGEKMSPYNTPRDMSKMSKYSNVPSAFEIRTQPLATL